MLDAMNLLLIGYAYVRHLEIREDSLSNYTRYLDFLTLAEKHVSTAAYLSVLYNLSNPTTTRRFHQQCDSTQVLRLP